MIRLHVHSKNPHKKKIIQATKVLQEGGVIIYPTDTVYGIGCGLYNKKAIEKIYQLKRKSKFDPVSIITRDIQQASIYAKISNYNYRILRHCLPGPYTFILSSTKEIPKIMLSKRKEIGIRIPENEVCHSILECFGSPLINTSVNIDSNELLNDPNEIEERYKNSVDLMLDSDWLPDAMESTVVRIVDNETTILREGKGDIRKLFE